MKTERIGNATLYLGTMEETIGNIQQADHILTDPPYLYIKTHDFDKAWDEQLFFENAKRLLPDDGFIALFGRGTSFYRWNTRLADLGFVFKEEIVWDKGYITSPHTKKAGKIRSPKVPYTEQRRYDMHGHIKGTRDGIHIEGVVNDIKRIKSAINTEAGLNNILVFLREEKLYSNIKNNGFGITLKSALDRPREISSMQSISKGMKEKSVIKLNSKHYKMSHPTEKPVRLAERILALISDPGDVIYDPFMGSGSFGVACIRTRRNYIGSEMKPEYFETARKRITEAVNESASLWENQEAV